LPQRPTEESLKETRRDVSPVPLPEHLTTEQAVDEALLRNLSLLAQRVNLSIADALLVAARVSPNPVLSLDADHLNVVHISKGDLTEASARVDVPIVLGGKRDRRIEVANRDRTIAEVQLEDQLRRLRQDVASACVDLLQAKATLALAKDNLQTFQNLVRINERRLQAGAIAAVELKRSKVSLLQFQSSVQRAVLDLTGAKTKLKTLLGRGVETESVDIVDDLGAAPSNVALDFPALLQQAMGRRPDLRTLEVSVTRAEADLRLQIANGIVDLSAGTEYRWSAQDHSERLIGLFLSVPIPLFNQNAGEIARARAQLQLIARQLDALKNDLIGEVRAAYEEFNASRELVRTIEGDLLGSAEEVRDTENKRYEAGATSFLEFLDAQRAFNEARQSLNDARATYRHAVINVNAAVGSEVIR
jgi:cobalt-zinc-cadmium efflux system outer membrane protein